MTSGEPGGTSGAWLAAGLMAAIVLAVTTQNIFSQWHDDSGLAPWEPVVWEYSSALAFLPCLLVPWLAARLEPPGRRWLRLLPIHALGSLAFSALHVGLFLLLRQAAYAVAGRSYAFAPSLPGFLYEYRKDLLAYGGAVALFWLMPKLLARRTTTTTTTVPAPASAEPPFEVKDGSRLLFVPRAEIVAISSAGNYVEVLLADGRRPLTRMTLAQAEAALAESGFVRVHRSWLVNAARVRSLTPEGSGDYALELEGGVTAPLSRRFPQALERLRAR